MNNRSFAKLMKLWLELNDGCSAPNAWSELTYELVSIETGSAVKAEKLSQIAESLANECVDDMRRRTEVTRKLEVNHLMDHWLEEIRKFAERQMNAANNGEETGSMVGFEFGGVHVINPFVSECQRFPVDPVAYYGNAFLTSDFFSLRINRY